MGNVRTRAWVATAFTVAMTLLVAGCGGVAMESATEESIEDGSGQPQEVAPQAAPEQTDGQAAGKQVSLGDGLHMTILDVRRSASVSTWQGSSVTGDFLGIQFRIENTGNEAKGIGPSYFAIVFDRDGDWARSAGRDPTESTSDEVWLRGGEQATFLAWFDLYDYQNNTSKNTSVSQASQVSLSYHENGYSWGFGANPVTGDVPASEHWPLREFWDGSL